VARVWAANVSTNAPETPVMNRNDLRRVDLNLLIVFETLMHERSVTRAAEKLFLGQPAISAALSRLRGLFDDPLFVRTGRSMEPTARAIEIFGLLSPALDSISTAVSRAADFDPATSTAVFRIGLSDEVEFALLPSLLKRLRSESPGIVLVVRRTNYILMPALLSSGEISIGVSYTDDLPANAKRKVLRRSKPKLLRADTMPGPITLDDFCARPHALVSFAGDLGGFIDEHLEKIGRKRHVVLAVPQFNGLATLIAGTDIVATVPDYAAAVLTAAGGVRSEELPIESRTFELHMAWRGSQDNDPGERWLRSRIQMFFGDPDSL
jgi:LysR family transcriptional activator of mexEF-oprN operon